VSRKAKQCPPRTKVDSCCAAGGFIGAKAKQEGQVGPAPIYENTSPEKQARGHGSLVSKAQCGGIG